MRLRFRQYHLLLAVVMGTTGLTWRVPPAAAAGSEAAFLAANNAAMTRMMAGMTIKPRGNIDHDFVAMMVPHHQGAIDMAQAELLYGHNRTLLRIAQEIVVEQQQEIAAMRLSVGKPAIPTWIAGAAEAAPRAGSPARQSATQEARYLHATDAAVTKMMTDMTVQPTGQVDADFVAMMVPHHQGAIDMAKDELRYGGNEKLKVIAQEIIVDQTQEITLTRLALGEPLPQPEASPTQIPAGVPPVAHTEASGSVQSGMRMAPNDSH